jgi:two-component system chemotaxis sensor kinase CheA
MGTESTQISDFAADAALLNDYLSETAEILERLETDLMAICTGSADSEVLTSIYRGLHTIKGLSATFGFEAIVHVSHAAEELVKPFNESRQALPDDTSELLLRAVDQLRVLQPDSSGQVSQVSDPPLLDELRRHSQGLRDRSSTGAEAPKQASDRVKQDHDGTETRAIRQETAIRVRTEDLQSLLEAVGLGAVYCDSLQEGLRVMGKLVSVSVRADLMRVLAGPLEGLERVLRQAQERGEYIRTVPVKRIFRKIERAAWEVAKHSSKQIRLDLQDNDIRIDQAVLGDISGPLLHIIRNAVDHGIESTARREAEGKNPCGLVTLVCSAEPTQITFDIRDDGAGIDLDRVAAKAVEKGLLSSEDALRSDPGQLTNLIFRPSFSTAERVTETSGRGVGMDVVATTVDRLGGRIDVETTPGAGSHFRVYLPRLSVSASSRLLEVLLVEQGGHILGLPSQRVDVVTERAGVDGKAGLAIAPDGRVVPRINLADLLDLNSDRQQTSAARRTTLFVRADRGEAALEVTGLPVPARVLPVPLAEIGISASGIEAAAILPTGELCLIVDIEQLLEQADSSTVEASGASVGATV